MAERPDDNTRGAAAAVDELPADTLDTMLDDVLARRTSPRRRAVRTVGVVALVVVAAGMLVRSFSSSAAMTAAAPARAAATPPVVLAANVNYGTLTLNGKRLGGPPPQVITPRDGENEVTLDAAPFPLLTCHFRAPLMLARADPTSMNGPCSLISASGGDAPGEVQVTIAFTLTGDELPPDLRASALTAIAQRMADIRQTVTVPVGDYYATGRTTQGSIISKRATTFLSATLGIAPSPSQPGDAQPSGPPCAVLALACAQPIMPDTSLSFLSGPVWSIEAWPSLIWSFADSSGAQVGSAAYQLAGPLGVYLAYDGAAGWCVGDYSFAPGGPPVYQPDVCGAGFAELGREAQLFGLDTSGGSGVTSADGLGCAIAAMKDTMRQGVFLWRFGVLLAADTQGHKLLPALPLAPPAEAAAARASLSSSSGLAPRWAVASGR